MVDQAPTLIFERVARRHRYASLARARRVTQVRSGQPHRGRRVLGPHVARALPGHQTKTEAEANAPDHRGATGYLGPDDHSVHVFNSRGTVHDADDQLTDDLEPTHHPADPYAVRSTVSSGAT